MLKENNKIAGNPTVFSFHFFNPNREFIGKEEDEWMEGQRVRHENILEIWAAPRNHEVG